jgi:predicted TIM-barrel fold metal-dependent hydrolase
MSLDEAVGAIALTDHHAHAVTAGDLSGPEFERLITESGRPAPAGTTQFDSQLGFAIRRWCAPVLGLEPMAPAADYLERRAALGGTEVTRRFLAAAGCGQMMLDTGFETKGSLSLTGMAGAAGAQVTEIVRLETVAELVAAGSGCRAGSFADQFRQELWQRTTDAAGLKSIIAYRLGLDFEPLRPSDHEVTMAAGQWLSQIEATGQVRLTDQVLLRYVLWEGAERGLPVQLHTGFGDPDLDPRRGDPLLAAGFLELVRSRAVPIMLLHCYPFHRGAGYLAQLFPHVYLDVGLALNYVGSQAAQVLAESMELAPFAKVLYSSDAYGLAELHYLGALQWRRATGRVLGAWVDAGEWTEAEAVRVASMIGQENAARVYRLP